MLRNAKVQEEIEKLRAKMETLGGLSRLKVREILCKIVMDPTSRGSDVLRAIAEDNKMMGRYKQKEEHKTDPWADLLRRIRSSEDSVQSRQYSGSPQLKLAGN